jgi:hypothetical protein
MKKTVLSALLAASLCFGPALFGEPSLASNGDPNGVSPSLSPGQREEKKEKKKKARKVLDKKTMKLCEWYVEEQIVITNKISDEKKMVLEEALNLLVKAVDAAAEQTNLLGKAMVEFAPEGRDDVQMVTIVYVCKDNEGNFHRDTALFKQNGETLHWAATLTNSGDQLNTNEQNRLIKLNSPVNRNNNRRPSCCDAQPKGAADGTNKVETKPKDSGAGTKEDKPEKGGSEMRNEGSYFLAGVVTLEAKTEGGRQLSLTLPADIRAGDTISGSVSQEGSEEKEETGAPAGASVEVGGVKYELRDRVFTFVVPASAASTPVVLKDGSGREVARRELTINQDAGPGGVAPPRIGQTGRIVAVPADCDGMAGNTRASFTPAASAAAPAPAPTNLPVVAESPRTAFVSIPPDAPAGAGSLTVEDAGARRQLKFNVLSVKLSADKLQLTRGEKTRLHAQVGGVMGLVEDNQRVTLELKILTPSVVRFSSTPPDSVTTKVTKDGVLSFGLTGSSAGAFNIQATLLGEPTSKGQ